MAKSVIIMFINMTNIPEMEIMAALAEGFFNAKCPKYSDNNYEKYIIVNSDTHKCSFQRGDYPIESGEVIFKCAKKEGCTVISIHAYLFDEEKPKRTVFNYDGEHITRIDGNDKNTDTGFSGEFVGDLYDIGLNKVVRGRITNVCELIDSGLYNEETVRDAYQAIGDFAKLIDETYDEYYPVYIRIPFCENCSYLFQYQCFSSIDSEKVCINYRFLGIISENVTKEDIELGREVKVVGEMFSKEFTPFLSPYEVRYLTEALNTAEEEYNKSFSMEDYEMYGMKTSFVMNRFQPKFVVETNLGIFHVIYERISDYALLYYSSDISTPMERIEGYGDFPAAFEVIKKKLEELSQDE